MSAQSYPGRGLSLSQLAFALNEELKRVVYSPIFTLEAVSQLDRDASIALAAIREWKNSFAHINRIPVDILSLIPTHLPTQKDRFHAASVCRHWRGVLLRHGALWSQVFLKKGEECVSTLLERAKGSALEVITDGDAPFSTIKFITPRAQQIVYLEFMGNHWRDIVAFSEFNSGQFPLLHTLKIIPFDTLNLHGQLIPPSLRLFRGSIDLQQFVFCSPRLSSLSHFVFPNLTTFKLLPTQTEEFSASCLLNFLEASPMLQTVEMVIPAKIILGSDPHETVVVLPNIETFSLHVTDDRLQQVHDFASHISCPCAKYTSLTHDVDDDDMRPNLEVFPTPVVWNTFFHQYMASPAVELTLEIKHSERMIISCFLTFRSSDATVVRLGFSIHESGLCEDELNMSHADMGRDIFSQALTTIRDHPLLSQVKRLHIKQRVFMSNTYRMANRVRELFGSLGPLDELTIYGCDLHMFLANFLDNPGHDRLEQPIVFPQIKEFAIGFPSGGDDDLGWVNAIVELARSHYMLGIPFERVTVNTWTIFAGMAERLGQWVAAVG